MTAIELKPIEQKTSLDVLYNFETDELNKISNHSYEFPEETKSLIQLKEKIFKPTKLYLTPKLHNGKHSNELIVEMTCHNNTNNMNTTTTSHKTDKIFICFTLSLSSGNNNSSLTFPMKTCPLEELVKLYGTPNLFYTTRNRHPVIVCPTVIWVGNDFPVINTAAKKVYKEIFESNHFDILSSIITLQDINPRMIEAGTNVVQFQKQLFSLVEGFHTISYESVSGYYMECNALAEGSDEIKTDFIITPLKSKVNSSLYGMIFFMFFFLGMFFVPIITLSTIFKIKPELKNLFHILFAIIVLLTILLVIIYKSKLKKMKKKISHTPRQNRKYGGDPKNQNSKNIYNQHDRFKHIYRDSLISLLVFLGLFFGELFGLMILLNSNYKNSDQKLYKLNELKIDYLLFPYSYIYVDEVNNTKTNTLTNNSSTT